MALDTIRYRIHGALDTKAVMMSNTLGIIHPTKEVRVCPSHFELFRNLITYSGKHHESKTFVKKEITTTENIDGDDFIELEYSTSMKEHFINKQILRMQDEKEVVERNMSTVGKFRLTSNESDITYLVNYEKGYIDFEFSIPKYLYKHNIAQFIPHRNSNNYRKYQNEIHFQTLEFQLKILFERFECFQDKFFDNLETLFGLSAPLDRNFVELMRIDFCFNQLFKNKKESLRYLESQRKIKNKYNPNSTSRNSKFDTSIEFTSETGLYFKIYHKGSEYQSKLGDKKKHKRHNSEFVKKLLSKQSKDLVNEFKSYEYSIEKAFDLPDEKIKLPKRIKKNKHGQEYTQKITAQRANKFFNFYQKNRIFDVEFLQNESDKILRYEVTFRPKFMSYHWKTKIFRSDDKYHKEFKKTFKRVASIYDSRNQKKTKKTIYKFEKTAHDEYKNWRDRSIVFTLSKSRRLHAFQYTSLSLEHDINDFNKETHDYNITRGFCYRGSSLESRDIAPVTSVLFKLMGDKFLDLFNQFQVEELKTQDEMRPKIEVYNKQAKENARIYNKNNEYKCYYLTGERKTKGFTNPIPVFKATQLLTQNELRKRHLKGVNLMNTLMLISHLEQGKNLDEIRHHLNLPASTFHRYKKDLDIFQINTRTQKIETPIIPYDGYKKYYQNLTLMKYRTSFFIDIKHNTNG